MKAIRNFVSALLSVAMFAVVLTAVVVAVPASATTVPAPPAVPLLVAGPQNPQPSEKPKGFLTDINVTADAKSEYGYTPGSWDEGLYSTLMGASYADSYNTPDAALIISNEFELAAFSKAVNNGRSFENKFVSLGQNIDLKGTAPTITKDRLPDLDGEPEFEVNITGHAYNVWEPIGNNTDNPFNGTFDGKGFEVSDMVVLQTLKSGGAYVGLFGAAMGGELKNVGVVNSTVISYASSSSYAGGLVGSSSSSITNSYATGDVYSSSSSLSSHAGGLVGSSSSITNSYATGAVYSSSFYVSYAGGLFGEFVVETVQIIANSYATGAVYSHSSSSSSYAGGLIGEGAFYVGNCFITNSYATGNIYSSSSSYSSYAGGLLGYQSSSASADAFITSSYATGNVYSSSSSVSYAGGLAGTFRINQSSISNSYATGNIYSSSSSSYAGGLVGDAGNITNSYSTTQSITAIGDTKYIGGLVGQNNGGEINQSYFDSTNVNYYGDGTANHDGLPETAGQLTSGNLAGLNNKPWTHPSGVYPTLDIIPAFETSYAPTYSIGDPIPAAQVAQGLSDLAPEYFIVGETPANSVAEINRFTGEITVLGPGTFKILALRVGGSEFQSQDVSVVSGTITISGDGPTPPPPPPPPVDTVPVFRVFNPLSGEHHYTRDRNESETLIASGWSDEGTAWVSPKTGAPVYRVFNSASGEHHYTKDHNEFQTLVDRGWRDEGISWHSGGTVPVQRVFNPRSGEHHYTKDRNEARTLIADGWTDEGTAWMAVS